MYVHWCHTFCISHSKDVISLQHDRSALPDSSSEYVKAAFLAHDPMLEVKKSYAERMEKDAIRDLVKEKKGILILDLDHTLFQVTLRRVTEEVPGFETWSFATEMAHSGQLMEDKTYWFNLDSSPRSSPFFIHLRPGLYSFLTKVSTMFELYAYTQGTSEYAKKILPGIDPKGDFFGTPSRLIAREVDPVTGHAGRKNLSRVFPNEEGLVMIIDDRDDVWDSTASSQNLIKLTPYLYFHDKEREKLFSLTPTSDPHFHPFPGNVKLKQNLTDHQLPYLERFLEDLYSELFFGTSPEEEDIGKLSFPSIFSARKNALFLNHQFLFNERINDNIYRLIKLYGGKVVDPDNTRTARRESVLLGVPGQARRGPEPELIHPWFVQFCIATMTVPEDVELFSIARIEQNGIDNMWDCVPAPNQPLADEDDFLNDLLSNSD